MAKFTTHTISPSEALSLSRFPLSRQPLRLGNLCRSHFRRNLVAELHGLISRFPLRSRKPRSRKIEPFVRLNIVLRDT